MGGNNAVHTPPPCCPLLNHDHAVARSNVGVAGLPGFIELFPVWPRSEPASFRGLLVKGGFEVTAAYSPGAPAHGVGSPVLVRSNAGTLCAVVNPWPGRGATAAGRGGGRAAGGIVVTTAAGAAVPTRWAQTTRGLAIVFNTTRGTTYAVALDA